jgi:hypothetical protein
MQKESAQYDPHVQRIGPKRAKILGGFILGEHQEEEEICTHKKGL